MLGIGVKNRVNFNSFYARTLYHAVCVRDYRRFTIMRMCLFTVILRTDTNKYVDYNQHIKDVLCNNIDMHCNILSLLLQLLIKLLLIIM